MSSKTGLNDSVDTYLTWANEDSVKYEDRLRFNQRALDILLASENDSLNRVKIFRVANRYYNLGAYDQYKIASKRVLEQSILRSDTVGIAKSYSYLGDYYLKTTMQDSAFYYYIKAEKIYRRLHDSYNLATVNINKATVLWNERDYFGSESAALEALKCLRQHKDPQKSFEAFTILGIVSNELSDYRNALEYLHKALEVTTNNRLALNKPGPTTLNNIGNVYQNMGSNQKAIDNFYLALSDPNLPKENPLLYSILLDNVAYSKLLLGKRDDEIPELFLKSLRIKDSINEVAASIFTKMRLAEFYLATDDSIKAAKISHEALTSAINSGDAVNKLTPLKALAALEPINASEYSNEYIHIKDSLQKIERNIKDKFARIQFETDEISLEKDKLAEQNRNLFLFFAATVMIGLLLFVIRSQRARNRELLLKQAQQKANEDIYNLMLSQQNKIEEGRIKEKKRIAQELHDGVLGRLFGARLNLDSLNKMDGAAAEEKRNNYLSELKNIEQDIREISHDLNREKFVLINNFVAILNNLVEEQSSAHAAEVRCNIDGKIKWKHIDNNLKINLYRITQEALQNINKYAKASEINIDITETDNILTLEIADNGRGFDTDKKSKGIGIQNMLTRTRDCNGTLTIKSAKDTGTTITISFPRAPKVQAEQYVPPNPTKISI